MAESNVSGFLRMVGLTDGTGERQASNFDYQSRSYNRKKHYAAANGLDIETGEILSFKPNNSHNPYKKMAYRSYNKSPLSGMKLPNLATIINLAIIGGIGLFGYKIYNKFFNGADSIITDAKDNAAKVLAKTYVDPKQAKADTLINTGNALAAKGLTVTASSQSLANTLHGWLDSSSVNHSQIISTIKKQNVQTFRLISVAYGTRPLNSYAKSPLHLLNWDVWSLSDSLFSSNKLIGTLKDHLRIVLTDSELKQISGYYSVI